MDESDRSDLEIRGLNLVDVSSECDTLLAHQFTENQNNNINSGLLEAFDAEKAMDAADVSWKMEQLPQSSEPLESERARKTGKCNLRKSLAWDTAFFTSAGVLDPDELSSMIKGVDKGGKFLLPCIEEDINRSIDSISTLDSESLTMENLEVDLFEDIRASIQKTSKSSNTTSSSKAALGKTETQFPCALKKANLASKNMTKQRPTSKKQIISIQGPGKLIKQSSGGSQGAQHVGKNGGLTSFLPKAPKIISRPNPILSASLERASLGANQAKGSSVSGKVAPMSKVPGLRGSSRIVPKPALSLKSSSLSSSTETKKKPPRSSSLHDSFGNASSADGGISPVKSNRRMVSRIVNPNSSSSSLQKPSKVALKDKEQAYLMSSKLSSNTSPASSISEWSLESSSSTSTVKQRSNTSRASVDIGSPCRSLNSDAPPALNHHKQSNDQISKHENKVNNLRSENLKKASVQMGAHSRPSTVKPSGLRMPSPKIGFFEGVKPVDRTPNGTMRSYSGLPAGPKIGAGISSPSGGSSKAKHTKLQPAKTMTALGNTKLDGKKSASSSPSKKPSNASTKVSDVSGAVKKLSLQVQNKSDGEHCLKAEEVGCEGADSANDVPDTGLDAEKTGSLGALRSEINLEKWDSTHFKDTEIAHIEKDDCSSSSICNVENMKPSEGVDEDEIVSLHHLKNNLQLLSKSNEKENTHFEERIDGLRMHVGAVDSKHDLRNELTGNSISQIELSHPNFGVAELSLSKELLCPCQKEGSPNNLSGPTLISLPPITSEIMASTRAPFAVKNSFSEEDLSTRLSIEAVEKTASFPCLESAPTENS